MLKSIIITAVRNIFRNRTFSLINLIGLSVSMSLGLLIITVIQEQFTFDNFHKDIDRIVRVNTKALRADGDSEPYASVPFPIGQVLQEDYTLTEEVVRINRRLSGDAIYGNVNVPVEGLLADPSFLRVFDFPLSKGDAGTALNDPTSLVLTHKAAEKIFGKQDPLNQTVTMAGYGEFKVTGVLAPFKGKTHFDFEVLGSTSLIPLLEKSGRIGPTSENWNNYYGSYVYLKLKPGRNAEELAPALTEISKKFYADLKLETRDGGYEFFTLGLDELTPGPILSNQMGKGMPILLVAFLGVLTIIIMVMACFNYTNLMIAKSLNRAREIGIRKVVGAKRLQVFGQFVGEAVVFSLFALAFSYFLFQLLKPAFQQLHIAQEFSTDLQENIVLYGYFLLFAILVGGVAGLLPAGYLSAFKPAWVLKDTGNLKVYSQQSLRKALIVAQFTFSMTFIILIVVIFNQVNYMLEKDYGFDDTSILNVRLQGVPFDKVATAVRAVPGVVEVGGISHPLGTWADGSSDYRVTRESEPFEMRDYIVDEHYISNLKLKFLAGANFDPAMEGNTERHVILNEKALERFKFPDPISAVGQAIVLNDSTLLTVVGVVQDFHFRPMNYEIGPLALRYDLKELRHLSARIEPGKKPEVVAALGPIWKQADPVHPLEVKLMSEEIDEAYTDSGFVDVVKIVGYISFLAVVLACLGMLGMAMYSTQTRIKEIGIRKVMGASEGQVVVLLSRAFLILIGIAACLGTPAGYFLASLFLDTYAYKAPITIWVLLSGVLVMAILGVITISSQTLKAALANPVKALRYE